MVKKYEITANVIGELYIAEPVAVTKDNMTFSFIPDSNKKLVKIKASVIVPDENNNFELEVHKDDRGIYNFVFNSDEVIYSELISEIQAIESHLSFKTFGSLESIDWEYPENKQYIIQQKDDNTGGESYSMSFKENNKSRPVIVKGELLQNIVKDARIFDQLNNDLAFFRMGCGLLKRAQYKLAYIHFYFIIENLYSNCKYKQQDVLPEYKKSLEFMDLSQKAYDVIKTDPSLTKGLDTIFHKYEIENSFDNLFLLFIYIRNDLHHYHRSDPKSKNTPFKQVDYKSITLLLQYITSCALFMNLGKINDLYGTSL